MRYVPMFSLFALLSALTARAQVLPASSGGCNVGASGLHVCDWLSGDPRSPLFVTRFILAPGAPLDSGTIVGSEVLIVVRNKGELVNEKRSPPRHIDVYDGLVMLMPKEEPYLLRNIGKESVELLVIEVRK